MTTSMIKPKTDIIANDIIPAKPINANDDEQIYQ